MIYLVGSLAWFSTVGRNKPVHGRSRHKTDKFGVSLPETPASIHNFVNSATE